MVCEKILIVGHRAFSFRFVFGSGAFLILSALVSSSHFFTIVVARGGVRPLRVAGTGFFTRTGELFVGDRWFFLLLLVLFIRLLFLGSRRTCGLLLSSLPA